MEHKYNVQLQKLIDEFSFEKIYVPDSDVLICSADVSRPGLALSGFFDLFDETRIELIGRVEHLYLEKLTAEQRMENLKAFVEDALQLFS